MIKQIDNMPLKAIGEMLMKEHMKAVRSKKSKEHWKKRRALRVKIFEELDDQQMTL